jgi:hypothetical protein
MAASSTLHVQCPECGTEVPITAELRGETSDCNRLMINVEPDLTDVWAHSLIHSET